MESASDLGSDHEDSDAIVISSRSRILISPRKKGSKAVSKLLGSAAEDVVEQLLRGTEGSADVVSKTKSCRVRVGRSERADGNLDAEIAQPKSDKRHAQPPGGQHSGRPPTGGGRKSANECDESVLEGSSISASSSAELSAPSSETESNYKSGKSKVTEHDTSRQRTRTDSAAIGARKVGTRRQLQQHQSWESSHSESDASSSTKSSSFNRSNQPSRRVQSKFDDKIRIDVDSNLRNTIKKKRNSSQSSTRMETAPKRAGTNGSQRIRRPEQTSSMDLDDSVILPTSATQEMEDLKQTLKNLANHDPVVTNSSHVERGTFLHDKPPMKTKSLSTRTMNQSRKYDSLGNASLTQSVAAWNSTSKLDGIGRHHTKSSRNTNTRYSGESCSDSDDPEQSIARRLFSTPPPQRKTAFSTPPTAPISSLVSKRTPQATHSSTVNGYSSGLNVSLTAAATSSAQGSRAVLSALKALQDKIRRLEEEREKLMQELSDVKVRARKREAEIASAEKQFAYEMGQTKESARAAYDALRCEREELKLELVKYEERRKAMEAELKHATKLTSTFSNKADDLQTQLQTSESQQKSLQTELDSMRAAHKQEVLDLRSKLLALQKENESALEQNKLLQAQFERESQNHAETRERLHESEQTVTGISQLNEKLVTKVWEANEIATKATKKTRKLQQSQRVSTLSRPTAASRAASVTGRNASSPPSRRGSNIQKKTRTSSATMKNSSKKRASQTTPANNLELLRAANLGRDIPFVLGTSAGRSHSIISNVQEAIRQCDTTYMMPATNPPPAPIQTRTRKNSLKSRKMSDVASGDHTTRQMNGASASILGLETPVTLVGSRTRGRHPVESDGVVAGSERSSKRPSAIRVPTAATAYPNPMKSQIMEDLQAAVENAEAEFKSLNRRYKNAVAKVESGRDGAAQLSTTLAPMLDELEAKGKQLNLLKQVYEQASHSTINPVRHIVHSPEAIRRKTASLKILNDYRHLEREAKSPRSAGTTPGVISPTGTNATSRRASFFGDDD